MRSQDSEEVRRLPGETLDVMALIRQRVREAIEGSVDEELEIALGAKPKERTAGRLGYRHGAAVRRVVTEDGPRELAIPRGRILQEDGGSREWHSRLLPRYQRRTRRVDEALTLAYLGGVNTRRMRRSLQPLLGSDFLSKSAISRIVGRIQALFEAWSTRDLSKEGYAYLYLDGMRLPIRMARRVVKVPVMAVLGVREDGQKVLVALQVATSESTASWAAVVQDLARRDMPAPILVLLDGNKGLVRAVQETWPQAQLQRCTKHKLENLLSKAPKHCHPELKRDYSAITHPLSAEAAQRAYEAFLGKWRGILPTVAESLEEAGEHLLTFTRFPKSQWKSLRTTNQIERLNGEFRRRTKTQGSFRNERSALVLLYGLVAFGQIGLRKIDGWQEVVKVVVNLRKVA